MMMMITFGKTYLRIPGAFCVHCTFTRSAYIVVLVTKKMSYPLSIPLLSFIPTLTSTFVQEDNVKDIFPTPRTSSGVGPCPDGWLDASFVNMGCLLLERSSGELGNLTWSLAEDWCQDLGGALVEIEDGEQFEFLRLQLQLVEEEEGEERYWWTSGTDAEVDRVNCIITLRFAAMHCNVLKGGWCVGLGWQPLPCGGFYLGRQLPNTLAGHLQLLGAVPLLQRLQGRQF